MGMSAYNKHSRWWKRVWYGPPAALPRFLIKENPFFALYVITNHNSVPCYGKYKEILEKIRRWRVVSSASFFFCLFVCVFFPPTSHLPVCLYTVLRHFFLCELLLLAKFFFFLYSVVRRWRRRYRGRYCFSFRREKILLANYFTTCIIIILLLSSLSPSLCLRCCWGTRGSAIFRESRLSRVRRLSWFYCRDISSR